MTAEPAREVASRVGTLDGVVAVALGDLAYLSRCLFRAVACLVQVLFALHGRWFVNEKGSVAEAAGLPRTPAGLTAAVGAVATG